MAGGHSVGKVFVEMDLDASRYKASQKALYQSATSTSLDIEKNFKHLGVVSDSTFDLMRRKAVNSFEMIAASSKSTAADIVRAEQAKSAQLQRIHEQQFGAQISWMDKVKTHWFAVTGAMATAAAGVAIGKSLVEAGMAAEKMSTGLESALGSIEAASEAEKFLRAESERLGLVFMDQVKSYVSLAAAARGTTMEGEQTRKIFTAVTTASTALMLSADETSGALNAIQQMMSKGNVQAEELRGQLGERLPGAFKMAAQAMGVTEIELNKMLETGSVLAVDMLPKLADALINRYGDAATKAAHLTQGEINRMKTAWTDFKQLLVDDLMPAITASISGMTSVLKAAGKVSETVRESWKYSVLMSDVGDGANTTEAYKKKAEDWASAMQKLVAVDKSISNQAYQQFMSARSRHGDDSLPYYVSPEKINKSTKAAQNYFNTIKDFAGFEPFVDMTSDIKEHSKELEKAAKLSAEYRTKLNLLLIPSNYDSDMFQGKTEADKRAEKMLADATKNSDELIKLSENTAKQMEKNFSDFYFDAMTGKLSSLADFWESILNTLARMTADIMGQITREMIFGTQGGTESLASQIGGFISSFAASANGNIFSGPGISAYSNQIVSQPTFFPFAKGVGLMGEAGSEAIMPLTRTAGGDLGVKSVNKPANVTVNIHNPPGQSSTVDHQEISFDLQGTVIDLWMDGFNRDVKGLRSAFGGR